MKCKYKVCKWYGKCYNACSHCVKSIAHSMLHTLTVACFMHVNYVALCCNMWEQYCRPPVVWPLKSDQVWHAWLFTRGLTAFTCTHQSKFHLNSLSLSFENDFVCQLISFYIFFNQQPLITRLMMKYIMADPEQDTLTRDNHLRRVREKCDV